MSWIKRLASSLRGRKLEDDLEKELAFHLEMRTREKIAAGDAPDDARRAAMARFGSVTRTKESCREQSTFAWLAAVRQDLHYAARNLLGHPGFTAAAVACLAIGIGANTVIFSFVNAFLFQPFPPGVARVSRASGNPISYPDFADWRDSNRVFDRVFGFGAGELFTIGQGEGSREVLGEPVAGDYFGTLGVAPAVGRMLQPQDEQQPFAVISYQFWHSYFHGDPQIAGKTVRVDLQPFTIVGVAPSGFHGMIAPWSTEVWTTAALHREQLDQRAFGWIAVGAHLKNGIAPRQAAAAMSIFDNELERRYPLQRSMPDPVVVQRPGLSSSPVWSVFVVMSALLMAVVGIIYLIACADVAGLLIARAAARRREILIRLSLGASRSRLIRQLLTESLLLGLLGAAAGTAISFAAGDALAAIFPESISHGFSFQHSIDLHVLAWTLALAVASVLFAGLSPSLRASRQNLASAGRTYTFSEARRPRLRQWLIVAQVAGSVLVLATAGVFVRSFQKTQRAQPGFDTTHLLTADWSLGGQNLAQAQLSDLHARIKQAVSSQPGVEAVSLADVLPLGNQRVETIPAMGEVASATVDSDYFRTMGIALMRGRQPQPAERFAAVVNETLANRLWPSREAVGQSLRVGRTTMTVIAVAANGKYWSLGESPRPFVYTIGDRFEHASAALAIRTVGPPGDLAMGLSRMLSERNPELARVNVRTGSDRLRLWLEPQRAAALLLGTLGLAALALAITGLYALLAQLQVERTPEIAVRVALGATRPVVLGLLLRQSAIVLGAGTAIGITLAAAVEHVIGAGIGAIGALDATVVATVVALLATVGTAATAIPAYRALLIDPASALKSE
jgi:predicted permease